MGWAAIITALLQIFGPILAEWLKKWLDSWLQATAAKLPDAGTYATDGEAQMALFDAAIAGLPRFAFGRRALLRRMRATASDAAKLGEDDWDELRGLAELAANE